MAPAQGLKESDFYELLPVFSPSMFCSGNEPTAIVLTQTLSVTIHILNLLRNIRLKS